VWRALRRLGVPDVDLEDVVHDVLLVVFRRLADYDRSRPIRPWLFGIALRVAADYRRKRHGSERTEELGEPVDPAEPADERLAADDARRLVLAALQKLAEDRQAVFILHDLDGEPMPRIALALGIPLATGYSRLRLARAEFVAEIRRGRLRRGEA